MSADTKQPGIDQPATEHGEDAELPAVAVDDEESAEREALRLVSLAQIRQFPDPVLRMQARDVESFDDDLRRLADRMAGLMEGAQGAGLAATQVGVLRRLFVFRPVEGEPPVAVANPEIVQRSAEVDVDDEGCLSLQGVLVPVERNVAVTLIGRDLTGADLRLELEGFAARVCQHELDHLGGALILDRTTDEDRRRAFAVLRPKPALGAYV